ncbi:MAG TPA: trypsin-like peptidase domain-containing protein [Mycobacteriales bacterium]|jgi:putative serine protease PepD|nr:trypsin-like peptidase domain-containing protein [Mycobacteriales bacterium]
MESHPPFTFDESPDAPTAVLDTPAAPPAAPYHYAPPAPAERPRPRYLAIAALATVCAMAGGVGGVVVGRELAPARTTTVTLGGSGSTDAVTPVQAAEPRSYVAVAAKVLPSVVSINVSTQLGGGTGSGVVIKSDGYILTNNHVVGDATSIRVTFNDGSTATARLVGADAASDLAVVKADKTGLPAATLGSSAAVRVGDQVLAVGSPLGLSGTVTAGIVSALNRPVNTTDQGSFGRPSVATVIDAIQTDAAINPGNSGGALVNLAGQVIGINSAIATNGGSNGNIGVGFAIPIDQAKVIATQLIETGRASRAQMGVSVGQATTADGETRAVLQAVTPGGPAERAGLRAGDVIVQIGDQRVTGADALIAAVRKHAPGETVTVTYERDGARHTTTVRLTDAAAG